MINTCQKPERESIDSKLLEVERKIKHVRMTKTESDVRKVTSSVEADLAKLQNELIRVKQRPDYLGKAGHREIGRLKTQFEKLQHLFWLRKRACLDLIEVFSELHQEEPEVFKCKVGLDENDFQDKEV